MSSIENSGIPWVEKYRPDNFEDIILDTYNKKILKNIIETSHFPNLLFFGPPGVGKTTTIINLINAYQEKIQQQQQQKCVENNETTIQSQFSNKELIIHLNASEERSIEIIRNQICNFVNSSSLFNPGMKFVILDEADYLTKNSQQALCYLLQNHYKSVRFCIICNYISKIDETLINEFICLRFNQLPENNIVDFLDNINTKEKLRFQKNHLSMIQKKYNNDVRSMVNFMQSSNQTKKNVEFFIIDDSIYENLYTNIQFFSKNNPDFKNECNTMGKIKHLIELINTICKKYNTDKKTFIKDFLNFVIKTKKEIITSSFLHNISTIIHFQECKTDHYVIFSLIQLFS